ncbi:MAG: aspartate/glutamate racemase family protein [Bacillota bacterium]
MSGKRIMWINPIGSSVLDEPIERLLVNAKQPDTDIHVVSLREGPSHLNYHSYEACVLVDVLRLVKQAEDEGYDAAIIGCFYDTGLWEAREITDRLVVTAPCEASIHLATTLGKRTSVIVSKAECIPKMADNVLRYGFRESVVSFKSAGLEVHEFQKEAEYTKDKLRMLASQAVESDMAEVIVLGCTAQFGFFRELQEEIGVPVIDAVMASLKYAELLIELRDTFGWNHSKAYTYQGPPAGEIRL